MADARLAELHRHAVEQIDRLIALARDTDPSIEEVTPVSGWSILDHVEHLALADEASLHQLEAALERDGGPALRLAGRLVLLVGWFPRGIGKAPETSRPASIGREAVVDRLVAVRERVAALAGDLDRVAAARGRASHPVFGGLTSAQWVRFLTIHHRHHLRIVAAIRQAQETARAA